MICAPCKAAGEYNRQANSTQSERLARVSRELATEYHKKCEYPQSCPCHHKVGDVIRPGGRK